MLKTITESNLRGWVGKIVADGTELYAPVLDGTVTCFGEVTDIHQIKFGHPHTGRSFKELLFPRTETILRFERTGKEVRVEDNEVTCGERVLFGAPPCDCAALPALDALFSWDYRDRFYWDRRDRTIVIGMSCSEPNERCFCTSVGLSPTSTAGSDIQLTQIEDTLFLVEVQTDKGERLVKAYESLFEEHSGASKERATEEAEAKLQRKHKLTQVKPKLDAHFESELWEEMARRCVECGICAFVCPSCYCFDIVDEGDFWGGARMKNWDSCCFKTYTMHASGHNPRNFQYKRYRNRVMHKFSYFPERFGILKCSGCGRCGYFCPVNIDIYDVVKTVDETFP